MSSSEQGKKPAHPETEAARNSEGRRTGEPMGQEAFGSDERFTADDGPGERGFRGRKGEDTPPGSVPGGSYGGGGGVQQGGFERIGPDEAAGDENDSGADQGGSSGSDGENSGR